DRVIYERRDWVNANEKHLNDLAEKHLTAIEDDSMTSPAELNAYWDKFLDGLREIENTVPIAKSSQHSATQMSPGVRQAFAEVKRCARDYKAFRTPELEKRHEEAELVAKELWKIERQNAWYDHVAKSTANLQGAYKKYHWALKQETAREPAHMPPLVEGEEPNITTHTSPQAKSDCLARALLLVSTDKNEQPTAPDLPFDVNPNQLPTCALLQYEDIDRLIRKMPRIRATVDGGVSNIFIKICRKVLVPHLLRFCKLLPLCKRFSSVLSLSLD
ncbi:uncharacterized protein K460DRAFT_276385, partial [Cucurbitaria berberidis CBS 394.84]